MRQRWRVLTQKLVLIMKSSIEPPIRADPTAIFKYQSRNFISLENTYIGRNSTDSTKISYKH